MLNPLEVMFLLSCLSASSSTSCAIHWWINYRVWGWFSNIAKTKEVLTTLHGTIHHHTRNIQGFGFEVVEKCKFLCIHFSNKEDTLKEKSQSHLHPCYLLAYQLFQTILSFQISLICSLSGITSVTQERKSSKSPGPTGYPSEFYKTFPQELVSLPIDMLNK